MSHSIYELYKTEKKIEQDGKAFLFASGNLRLTLARAGGSNQRFEKILTANSKPFRRAIQAELLSNEKAQELMMRTYAEAVIRKWETLMPKEDGTDEFRDGMLVEGHEDLQPKTIDNMVKIFMAYPELFKEVQEEANKLSNYQESLTEEDAKN
jgi:hypothetical protein